MNCFVLSFRLLNEHFFQTTQLHDTLSFLVTIKDRLDSMHDSENDNLVKVPINVIILDENDNSPSFQNVRTFQSICAVSYWTKPAHTGHPVPFTAVKI